MHCFEEKDLLKRLAYARDRYYLLGYGLKAETDYAFIEIESYEQGLVRFNYFDDYEKLLCEIASCRVMSMTDKRVELEIVKHMRLCQ